MVTSQWGLLTKSPSPGFFGVAESMMIFPYWELFIEIITHYPLPITHYPLPIQQRRFS